jgi:hypothetical protein
VRDVFGGYNGVTGAMAAALNDRIEQEMRETISEKNQAQLQE